VPSLPISLHRSPIAGAKFTDLHLQIPPYRQMAKKKKKKKERKRMERLVSLSVNRRAVIEK
jgi:hypothetical protein